MSTLPAAKTAPLVLPDAEFTRGLGLADSTMIVVGSMIGVGIFIVTAGMARQVGSPGFLLLAWVITGVLTVAAALSYGELAAMLPRAGGQYVYLREAFSPLWGFLYGWTLFLVIQTGTIAAVAVGFARYVGVLWPGLSEERYLIAPVNISSGYAVSLSTVQLLAIAIIGFLTWANSRGLEHGRIIQNLFTWTKGGVILILIAVGLSLGWSGEAVAQNFGDLWTPRGFTSIAPGVAADSAFGLIVAMAVCQAGSLFAADGWNNITFAAGEVKNPRRDVPMSLAIGTGVVMAIYLMTNLAYLVMIPLDVIQNAPADRVAAAALGHVFPGGASSLVAVGVLVSSFGCVNAYVLSGARAYYAMARDRVFFETVGRLNHSRVPAAGLWIQGLWAAILVLPRTVDPVSGTYGNLYSDLLTYVVSASLTFYVLTILGVFRLRQTRPDTHRPYRAWGYPWMPALYILGATAILVVLLIYQPAQTWPGLAIVLLGLPVYVGWRARATNRVRH
jgi:APA family basic amino acid/polyamine antiporter